MTMLHPKSLPALIIFLCLLVGCDRPNYFSKKNKFTLVFDDALGLIRGGPVTIAGVRIGKITTIKALQKKAFVGISIDSDTFLFKNAIGTIRSKTLLGEKVIELDPGDEMAGRLLNGATILVNTPSVSVDSVLREAYFSLHSLRNAVGLVSTDDAAETRAKIRESIQVFGQFFRNLKTIATNMSAIDKESIENWLNKEGVLIRLFPST